MTSSVPTVLVTGASGYIATHIVQQLLRSAEYKVRGTVRSLKNEEKVAPLRQLHPNPKYPLELVEANLSDEACWLDAVKGCEYVVHTASPFPLNNPKSDDEVILPAVNGTLSVLKACKAAGGVKRVVVTSSVVAIAGESGQNGKFSEKDWLDTDQPGLQAYGKSKALAEKAAWDFIKELPEKEKFELAVINPVFVMGPVLNGTISTSQEVLQKLLQNEMPMLANMNMSVADVRDVAKAHIVAMTLPEAAGNRHIVSDGNMWMVDMAKVLQAEFKPQGYKVPTCVAPDFLIKFSSLFDANAKAMKSQLNKVQEFENDRMVKVLGIEPIKKEQSLIDMAYSMIEMGKIKKTSGYKGPPKQ